MSFKYKRGAKKNRGDRPFPISSSTSHTYRTVQAEIEAIDKMKQFNQFYPHAVARHLTKFLEANLINNVKILGTDKIEISLNIDEIPMMGVPTKDGFGKAEYCLPISYADTLFTEMLYSDITIKGNKLTLWWDQSIDD